LRADPPIDRAFDMMDALRPGGPVRVDRSCRHARGRSRLGPPTALVLALIAATPALAAETATTRPSEAIFIGQIILLLSVGRLMGEVMQRIGQPAVMGQLLAGLLLGPSVLGSLWPQAQHMIFPANVAQKSMIDAVSQLGILMLLLLTGMETDLSLVRKTGRAALSVSAAGIAIPFACGFALGEFLPEAMLPQPGLRLVTSLFLGTVVSISSVKIVAMVVREMRFMRRDVGQVIIASAIIDDTIGWTIIAIIFGLALHGTLDLETLARSVIGTALFLIISFSFGRWFVFTLIRWTNDTFVSEVPVITTILVIMGLMALATNLIGVHTVLGAFVAGILVGQSPILTRHIDDELRGLITALFMPVFFGLAGLGADLTILKDPNLLLLTLGLVLIASLGKFGGAFLGGWLGGLTRPEALALGCAMNARGSTEVIVATIGLSIGALSQNLYTMIVAMAVVTTMAMPPTLRWTLGRLPLRDEERARLEREAFEMGGFETNLERLLVAVDGSPKSRFAVRLAGLLAGSRGMPVTVLGVGSSLRTSPLSLPDGAAVTVEDAQEFEAHTRKAFPPKVKLLTRVSEAPVEEVVADEARKGYGLLIVGVERSADISGGFHENVARMASGFRGPLAVAVARGAHADRPLDADLRILIPITGTDVSRRGAEVGLALARATSAPAMALHIAGSAPGRRRFGGSRRGEDEILRHIVGLADGYGVLLRTATRVDLAAEDAILRQARLGGHNLIVMGVTRRPGESLFFGNVATAILESSERSILFVAS
jgi:Kef-type K+ transport system membrane component KefB/nucleotide-binding universal stress UspA family protein